MSGYETWKRDSSIPLNCVYMKNGVRNTQLHLDRLTNLQETMSYRTHGSVVVEDPNDPSNLKVTYDPRFENPIPNKDSDGKLWDTGHEFYTHKKSEKISHRRIWTKNPNNGDWYRGPLDLLSYSGWSFPNVYKMSEEDRLFYGAKAIARTTPTQPLANTSQMVGELLSEGLPISGGAVLRIFERLSAFKAVNIRNGGKLDWRDYLSSVGDSTLALKFGAEPLVRDMADIMFAVSSAAQRIEQWRRDSGRQIRRSTVLDEKSTLETFELRDRHFIGGFEFGGPNVLKTQDPYPATLTRSTKTEIKFSGAYMYYATVGETILDRIVDYGRKADLIMGGKTTFETLWEIAPWSWLVDWKVNVGDAISNATRFSMDKLVLRYGYLQKATYAFSTYAASGYELYDQNPGTVWRQFSVVQKERYKATPYGFGANPESFSEDQWAILAALGLSKGGRKLP